MSGTTTILALWVVFAATHMILSSVKFRPRVNASELAFFGGLPLFAVVGCWHQDQRKLETLGESFQRFHAETAFLPFARGGFRGIIEAPIPVAIGVATAAILRFFHGSLFGG
jgi:uncharacterized membrane protein